MDRVAELWYFSTNDKNPYNSVAGSAEGKYPPSGVRSAQVRAAPADRRRPGARDARLHHRRAACRRYAAPRFFRCSCDRSRVFVRSRAVVALQCSRPATFLRLPRDWNENDTTTQRPGEKRANRFVASTQTKRRALALVPIDQPSSNDRLNDLRFCDLLRRNPGDVAVDDREVRQLAALQAPLSSFLERRERRVDRVRAQRLLDGDMLLRDPAVRMLAVERASRDRRIDPLERRRRRDEPVAAEREPRAARRAATETRTSSFARSGPITRSAQRPSSIA